MSELKVLNGSKTVFICFGGHALKIGGIIPFEFLNFISKTYSNSFDSYYFVDKNQSWYHRGLQGITNNIEETITYIKSIIDKGKYEKIICMGVSAGGYASILFGSECGATDVISFIPRTKKRIGDGRMFNEKYFDLKHIINDSTKYFVYGDLIAKPLKKGRDNCHHISHCYNLRGKSNVNIIPLKSVKMRKLRDRGLLKQIIDNVLNN